MARLVLASASPIRARLLREAGVDIEVAPARIDEAALRESLRAEGAVPREIADVLAEHKARQVAGRRSSGLVLGCDQILELDGQVLGKPEGRDGLRERLRLLRARTHRLHSAAVLYADAAPVWRHVSDARLTMRAFSDGFLEEYLDLAGDDALQTAGGYAIEAMGIRLFARIEGDFFGILGLPLLEVLAVLTRRGEIAG